jgi:hypothetical protein
VDVVMMRLPEPIQFHELAERLVVFPTPDPGALSTDEAGSSSSIPVSRDNTFARFVGRTVAVRRASRTDEGRG